MSFDERPDIRLLVDALRKITNLSFDINNYLQVNLQADSVGLAKEATLSSIDSKITSEVDYSGTRKVIPIALFLYDTGLGGFIPVKTFVRDANNYAYMFMLLHTWGAYFAGIGYYRTYASILAANNTGGLSHVHTKHNRNKVSVWVRCGGPCTWNVYVSFNGVLWRRLYDNTGSPVTISLETAGETMRFIETAYTYIRFVTEDTGIDLEIEVVSSAP